jgi:hypothetical protein
MSPVPLARDRCQLAAEELRHTVSDIILCDTDSLVDVSLIEQYGRGAAWLSLGSS